MSRRDDAAGVLAGGDHAARPAGLLEKLIAAIRPQFRSDDLVFDPRDPVFGGPPCAVSGCERPGRARGLCSGHHQRWAGTGKPDLAVFAAATRPGWFGHAPLASCDVAGCRYGRSRRGLCGRHAQQWDYAGQPEVSTWIAGGAPLPAPSPVPLACRIAYCGVWAQGSSPFCRTHDRRWKTQGRPPAGEYARMCEQDAPAGGEHIDLQRLPAQLKLEIQYALQRRRDEGKAKVVPVIAQSAVHALARTQVTSLLDWPEESWARIVPPGTKSRGATTLLLYARRHVEDLACGRGWQVEYPRDVWRLRKLDIDAPQATIRFDQIPQPWLKELAKRWTRWRLSTGMTANSAARGVRAISRLAAFLPPAASHLTHLDRQVIERYLADLHAALAGTKAHRDHVGQLGAFLLAIRQHRWDDALPASAAVFPEDYPKDGPRLPRALAEHVMAQVENPACLNLWGDPMRYLITLILIRCGLRISDAVKLPRDCIVHDANTAPYLRYYNHKMKREALVPIDEELQRLITEQQRRTLAGWPGGPPVLFPKINSNLDGTRPYSASTYRQALYRWLRRCDISDEHGQPVHLTPHQWRHTLGTRLTTSFNRDVPQEVVRRILDHDSHAMTAHYARLSDTTIRRHWEAARKVDTHGKTVTLDPGGPLAEAAWAKQRLGRATQALPNGFCGLPLVQTCPHANAPLTELTPIFQQFMAAFRLPALICPRDRIG